VTTTTSRRAADAARDPAPDTGTPAETGDDGAHSAGAQLERPIALGQVLRIGAAGASLAAAAIHASAISDHSFHALHAVAFVAMAAFQAWWAYLLLRGLGQRMLLLGAAGHGAIAGLWLLSRVWGLPAWVPGSHGVEASELKDALAFGLTVAVLVAIDVLSRPQLRARSLRPSTAGAATGAAVVLVVLLGVVGAVSTGHVHDDGHHHGPAPAGTDDHGHGH
jgi:hypothetical protein